MNEDRSKLVPFERARRIPDPARVAEFAATARRLQYERESSADVVARALRETREWKSLAVRPELRTSGALEALSKEVDARLDSKPQEALQLAELETVIAQQVDSYPAITLAQLRAHAWKDLGQTLMYVARYEEALQALDRADACLAPHGTLAHDQAIVDFVRATTLQHLRRFEEAQELLHECRVTFRTHGDSRLYAKTTLAAGNLLVRRGDYFTARKILTPLLHRDSALIPIARMALGWCAIHLGDGDEALQHFTAASSGYRALGRDVEVERALYGAATSLLRLGRFEDALGELEVARARFLSRGLIEEAGLSGLDMVETQMVLGYHDDARELAATLVHEFTQARLNRRAVAALAYLNDAIAASSATPEIVHEVHAYIRTLQSDPTCEFAIAN